MPDPDKVQGIQDFPPCEDVSDVRRFLGVVNQMGKFSGALATVSQPIRELLQKDSQWCWGMPQEKAFNTIKELLTTPPALALYHPERPTRVSADASSYGLGAVILQQQPSGQWQPVSYQSRSMAPAETRYAQIEKEALALTWACDRFADFLVGRRFCLETDHKPLVPLLSSIAWDDIPPRILRFRLRLARFDFEIVHVPGKELVIADALSRSPKSGPATVAEVALCQEAEEFVDNVFSSMPATDARLDEIRHHQHGDADLQAVRKYVLEGWPDSRQIPDSLASYVAVRGTLSVANDLLMCGCRIVIPVSLRSQVLQQIHSGHLGITKCRERAKQSVWWPSLSSQLAQFVSDCVVCAREQQPIVETLRPSELPQLPWQKVAADFFQYESDQYLLLVDYFSRYMEVARVSSLSASVVVQQFKSIFARHGYPETLVSDNGPPFSSSDFSKWLRSHGICHVTSSPLHPEGNGLAERHVKTVKSLLRKTGDLHEALLSHRSTPLESGFSPAELLMGRRVRTLVPMSREQRRPFLIDVETVVKKDSALKLRQADNHDQRHRARDSPLPPTSHVYVPDRSESGVVTSTQSDGRSLVVETPNGSYRRNRQTVVREPFVETAGDSEVQLPLPGATWLA